MRIVHLDTGRDLRGGQRQLLLLARKLAERGHKQLIVCPAGSPLEARLLQLSLDVFSLPLRGTPFSRLPDLRRRISREQFQVLHAHDGRSQTLSAFASLGLPVRRVATRRVTFMPQGLGGAFGIIRLQYGPACDAVIAVSGFVRDVLAKSGIPMRKIEVIPDGVEMPAELPNSDARVRARHVWSLDRDAFVIGHAGAFTHEKGQDLLLSAFLAIMDRVPQARLLFVGDGPLRSSRPIVEGLRQASGRVQILEPMEELTPFFAALDVYAMPSRAEGLGSSALLAMAHGLPVIATRVGGLAEVVADGESGWLVPSESPPALAEALLSAACNEDVLRRYAPCARGRAEVFSSDTMVSRTEALYRRLTVASED